MASSQPDSHLSPSNASDSPAPLPVPLTRSGSEATRVSNSPLVDPETASNEESARLSDTPRLGALRDEVSSSTVPATSKEDSPAAVSRPRLPSPSVDDVSSMSERHDWTETVRREPSPCIAESPTREPDTGDCASSSSDEPSSSMLDRKGRPIRQTPVQHTPTPAIPKAASRLRSQHATVKAARAKGPSHVKRPEDAFRASYAKLGLDARQLVIVAEAQPLNPLSLFVSSAAKARAELTERRYKMLYIDSIKGLCDLRRNHVRPRNMMDIITRQRQRVTKDMTNLLHCLESFALEVTKHHNEAQVSVPGGLGDGHIEPLQSSRFANQIDACLVFLDQARTRDIDLKMPSYYRAAVMLGANLSKDCLVQACMGMRKLGKGQSVTFCATDETRTKIQDCTLEDRDAGLTNGGARVTPESPSPGRSPDIPVSPAKRQQRSLPECS
ncbi:hypothetical protein LTR74_017211 [Friedmanniomyces endolithicus]|nr:hypothetical protein LTR74_017211 [Friedmanniomyces endolithicus]